MILLRALYDGMESLKNIIHEESIITMIGVSMRFLDPFTETYIHNFWTIESSKADKKVS